MQTITGLEVYDNGTLRSICLLFLKSNKTSSVIEHAIGTSHDVICYKLLIDYNIYA